MSIAEKWEEYWDKWAESKNRIEPSRYWKARIRESFYAGAEAATDWHAKQQGFKMADIQAEIDRFKGHVK